jgi:hypothetical protein
VDKPRKPGQKRNSGIRVGFPLRLAGHCRRGMTVAGSVKGFITDNPAIKGLKVFDEPRQMEIEKILQIRHLFTHQNGIVDDKFRKFFPAAKINDEFQVTLDDFLQRFEYLAETVEAVDEEARKVFKLACYS